LREVGIHANLLVPILNLGCEGAATATEGLLSIKKTDDISGLSAGAS